MKNVIAIIDNNKYKVILEDNENTKAFLKFIPQEFIMNDLNGNEKLFI